MEQERKKQQEAGRGTPVRPLLYVSELQTVEKSGSLIVPIYRLIETVASISLAPGLPDHKLGLEQSVLPSINKPTGLR
jgi:hypothetical protein